LSSRKEFEKDNPIFHLIIQVCKGHYLQARERLEEIDLYRGQPRLLHLLQESDGRSQKEICEALNLKPATVTKTVKRMEKKGFLQRRADSQDQRLSRIFLTEKGREAQSEAKRIEREMEELCLDGFTREEVILLRRFLIQIRDNLKED